MTRAWTKAEAKKVLDQLLAHGCARSKKVWRKVSSHQVCYWVLLFAVSVHPGTCSPGSNSMHASDLVPLNDGSLLYPFRLAYQTHAPLKRFRSLSRPLSHSSTEQEAYAKLRARAAKRPHR